MYLIHVSANPAHNSLNLCRYGSKSVLQYNRKPVKKTGLCQKLRLYGLQSEKTDQFRKIFSPWGMFIVIRAMDYPNSHFSIILQFTDCLQQIFIAVYNGNRSFSFLLHLLNRTPCRVYYAHRVQC